MRRSSKTEQANQSPDNPSFENIERRIKKSTDSMQKYCLISLIQFISFFMINWIRSLCVSRHKWAQLQKCVSQWTFVVKWAKMIRVSFAYIFVYYHTDTDKSDDYVGDQTEGMSFINDCAPNSNDIILFFMSFFFALMKFVSGNLRIIINDEQCRTDDYYDDVKSRPRL